MKIKNNIYLKIIFNVTCHIYRYNRRRNPDQAAAYVLAYVVLHNIEIGRVDIMYNKQDVNATPYNPKSTTWLLTAQRTDVGLHSPEIFWIKKHANTITQFFFSFYEVTFTYNI